jgi:hypothetical protein
MTRRDLLKAALAAGLALAWPRRARASDFNRFRVAQLVVGDKPPARPDAAFVLGQEVRFRTAVDVKLDRVVVPLGSRALFDCPFLLWVGDGPVPDLDERGLASLSSFLDAGGFLVVDNAGDGADQAVFDRQFRAQIQRAFPGKALAPVPAGHVLLRSFYRVTSVWGRRAAKPALEGLFLEDRLALVYSQNDLSGAWSRDGFGNWEYECVPGGPVQREGAIRLGVNLVLYALLLDYKDEQAHVDWLLRRRRLRREDVGR